MSRTYSVTSFDACVPGYERLRSNSEFILVAYPRPQWGKRAMMRAFLEDMESVSRPDGFDYRAARQAVRAWFRDVKAGRFGIESGNTAFLYVNEESTDET